MKKLSTTTKFTPREKMTMQSAIWVDGEFRIAAHGLTSSSMERKGIVYKHRGIFKLTEYGLAVRATLLPKWIRYRFKTESVADWRPVVFDPRFPYWCSGVAGDDSYATIVAWLPGAEPLKKYWDDAFDVESTEHDEITFTDRFPKPNYFTE